MKKTLSLMTVCGMLLALVARGQVAPAENSKTNPVDPGDTTAGLAASASPPASMSPVITRVSPILPRSNQTIVIEGSGFGNTPPKLIPMGDAVDTDARNGQRPALAIGNHGLGPDNWQAGLARDGDVNALGVKLESWTDTKITLTGFGNALGDEQSNATWKIAAGDPIEITVFGPTDSKPAVFAATVTAAPPADRKTSVAGAQASSEPENVKSQILFSQWFASLPALVVWTVGLVLALKRWRERPQVSKLVAISCGVALLTLILMPLALQIGYQIGAFFPPLMTLIGAFLGALPAGLLLKVVFAERGKSDLPAPETPGQSKPAVITGPMGTALKIFAGIVRWTWRLIFIAVALFVGTFLVAGLGQMHLPTDPGDIAATLAGVFVFGVAILGWWREGLAGLILLVCVVLGVEIESLKNQEGPEQMLADIGDSSIFLAVPLLMLLSWLLHALKDGTVASGTSRPALVIALLLVIAALFIAAIIYSLLQFQFPANA